MKNAVSLMRVIVCPIDTHKSMLHEVSTKSQKGVCKTFRVARWANKIQIAQAIEELFDQVKVDKVRTLIVRGKAKNFRGKPGKTKSWKKAFVVLKEGFDINFAK